MEDSGKPRGLTAKKGTAAKIRKLRERYPEMSKAAIARKVGCTPGNVTTVLKTFLNGISEVELQDYQNSKADIYDAIQMRALGSITPEKLVKESAVSLGTLAAIMEDKSRLVRGQATSINATLLLDAVEALRIRSLSPTTIDAKSIQGVSIEPSSE